VSTQYLSSKSNKTKHPLVVVSAVALVNGGMFEILRQCIESAAHLKEADFIFLVHTSEGLPVQANTTYMPFPRANHSYFRRLYTEYVSFMALSRQLRPDIWLSLHDTTPRVIAGLQAVYCHNSLPYFRPRLKHALLEPFLVVRAFLYGWIYRFRSQRNDFVIAQLPWFTSFLGRYMAVPADKLIAVRPNFNAASESAFQANQAEMTQGKKLICFYPSLPRVYKNFEEAIDLCANAEATLWVTLKGDENRYAKYVHRQGKGKDVVFMGLLTHEECLKKMALADVILFPSDLESFGLPILEAMSLGKTLVLPVRPWTVEIAGAYQAAHFYENLAQGREIVQSLVQRQPRITIGRPKAENSVRCLEGFTELLRFLIANTNTEGGQA